MKTCAACNTANPDAARYCMRCGHQLALESDPTPGGPAAGRGLGTLALSLLASVALSLVLMFVFRVPVFLVFGLLPLFWWRRKP
jgi:hypothetical protein